MASHSVTETAIGFSTITCFPLRSKAIVCGAWSAFGVATTAASMSGSAASASQSVVTRGIAYRSANVRALSSRWFVTATSSSPCAITPRAWKSWIQPHPNRATRVTDGSPLDAGERHTFDERALGQEEQDDDGQHEHERRRHRQVPLGAVPLLELRETDRQRPQLLVLPQEQERREQIVPVVEEVEQRHRGDRRLGQRDDHARHDLELARAVDPSCVGQLFRDRQEELPEQEDRERVAKEA